METYSEFSPTQFDPQGAFLDDHRQDWLVAPAARNRDSDALQRSNFRVVLADLGGESEDVEVHRFGHWACGWLEIIIVRPGSTAAAKAEEWEAKLADYPVAYDEDFSREEYEEACELWASSDIADRVHYIKRCGAYPKVSIFAARRDELPGGIYFSEMLGE